MATRGGRECKLCRYGGGFCQPGFKKTHVRDDPQCRLHGVTQRTGTRLMQPYTPPQQTPPVTTTTQSTGTPLDQKTAFRTQGGLHLLFEPEAMDAWMTRRITTNDEGDYVDAQTGETLGAAEKADYEGYLHRLGERYRVGEQADRLVRIVDKHLPKADAENRAYVMKYPHKVHKMLKKAWALRKRLRAKSKHKKGEKVTKCNPGDRDAEPTPPEPAERPQDERGNPEPHVTKDASDAEAAAPAQGTRSRPAGEPPAACDNGSQCLRSYAT